MGSLIPFLLLTSVIPTNSYHICDQAAAAELAKTCYSQNHFQFPILTKNSLEYCIAVVQKQYPNCQASITFIDSGK